MNRLRRIMIYTGFLVCLTACEKTYNNTYYYGEGKDTNSANNSNGSSSKGDTGKDKDDSQDSTDTEGPYIDGVLTVEQALNQTTGSDVTVEGYIVGTSKTSLKSAVYTPPFYYDTSFILSDTPYHEGEVFDENHLIQVALTSPTPTDFREGFNLKDNPELWNTKFQVGGFIRTYYNRTALKGIYSLQQLE